MLQHLLKVLGLVTISAFILGLLDYIGVLNAQLFHSAFVDGGIWLGGVIFFQALMSLLAILRYFYLLRVVKLDVSLKKVSSATLVSQALGQWSPGSTAVIEVFRLGMMIGFNQNDSNAQTSGVKGKITLASLLDRFIGQAMMFIIGGICAFVLLIQNSELIKFPSLVLAIGSISLLTGLVLMALPFFSHLQFVQKIFAFFLDWFEKKATSTSRPLVSKVFRGLHSLSSSVITGLKEVSKDYKGYLLASTVSSGIFLASALTFYYSALAMNAHLSLLSVLITFPILSFGSLLPLGFAGFGGHQLIAVGLFSAFNVNPEVVVASSLVQSSINIVIPTVLGIVMAGFSLDDLKELLLLVRGKRKVSP